MVNTHAPSLDLTMNNVLLCKYHGVIIIILQNTAETYIHVIIQQTCTYVDKDLVVLVRKVTHYSQI